jgi:hypothetical protein
MPGFGSAFVNTAGSGALLVQVGTDNNVSLTIGIISNVGIFRNSCLRIILCTSFMSLKTVCEPIFLLIHKSFFQRSKPSIRLNHNIGKHW